MTNLFIDLTDEEVKNEIKNSLDKGDRFYIERDGQGFLACIEISGEEEWLPNNYANESIAMREILAEVSGERSLNYYN